MESRRKDLGGNRRAGSKGGLHAPTPARSVAAWPGVGRPRSNPPPLVSLDSASRNSLPHDTHNQAGMGPWTGRGLGAAGLHVCETRTWK